ncbi:MAG: penicillin-binding protein 1C [Bacteroidota bacterium]
MEDFRKWLSKYKPLLIFFVILLLLFILDRVFPVPQPKPFSKLIYANDGTLLCGYLSQDDKWRMRCRLEEISPDLIKTIIEKEDKYFYYHFGINPVAVARAATSNIYRGRRVSGASTISMQVARMLQPAQRSYFNKIIEIIRAFQLELHYSKSEILELYMSLLPYGGNIEGVKAASYIYFNRPPNRLSLAQSVVLAIIPNNPNAMRMDKSAENVCSLRNFWIRKLIRNKTFSNSSLQDALYEQIVAARYPIPSLSPHFCYYVGKKYNEDILETTLNPRIQKISESLLQSHVNSAIPKGITNGSVIVIDNKTGAVLAYCGSSDFYNTAYSGQVDGVRAIRSPGSTLKAGLYAYAFDQGVLTPKMKLLDIPTEFAGFEPENYTQEFEGEVTAEFALVNSLNIPAVRLLQLVGLPQYINLLEKAGFREITKEKKKLGLSMILGGCGVRLEQLATYFTAFANQGKMRTLKYLKRDTSLCDTVKLFSEGAVFLVLQILSSNERPDFPNELLNTTKLPHIAWKTGTSFGKKDAWAIGVSPRYTIGVWMGNFDGKGSPHLSGAEMAVPLLFALFNSIDYDSEKRWFEKPATVSMREVCAETGLLPSQNCTQIVSDYFIKGISNNKVCDLYKEVFSDEYETVQYCTGCLPPEGYKKVWYPHYDPELILWYEKNNVYYKRIPPHNKSCQARFTTEGPKILSPSQNYEYLIESGSRQQILLQAASPQDIKLHHWYINDVFYKTCKPEEKLFFVPDKGKTKISCMDDKGRNTIIFINVKNY